jgi:hypothetical protein
MAVGMESGGLWQFQVQKLFVGIPWLPGLAPYPDPGTTGAHPPIAAQPKQAHQVNVGGLNQQIQLQQILGVTDCYRDSPLPSLSRINHTRVS